VDARLTCDAAGVKWGDDMGKTADNSKKGGTRTVPAPTPPTDDLGRRGPPGPPAVPDYEMIRHIGGGSYGDIWIARSALDKYVAVKVVYRDRFPDDCPYNDEFNGLQLFESVSEQHAGLVKVKHVGKDDEDGLFYCVLELADDVRTGREITPARYKPRTLRWDLKHKGKLPLETCVEIGCKLADALACLHEQGLAHRDVKPGNIVFVDGEPKLADVGLVQDIDAPAQHVGTPAYIPPEGQGTAAGDVYSLGKVLYELSTGKDPRDFPELPTNLSSGEASTEFRGLNRIVLKACHLDARKRYRTARELLDDLRALPSGAGRGASGTQTGSARGWKRLAVAAAAVVCAISAPLVWRLQDETPPDAQQPAWAGAFLLEKESDAAERLLVSLKNGAADDWLRSALHGLVSEQRDNGEHSRFREIVDRLASMPAPEEHASAAGAAPARPRVLALIARRRDVAPPTAEQEAKVLLYGHGIRSALREPGKIIVVPRDNLTEILRELELTKTGLSDQRVGLAVGKVLPACLLVFMDVLPLKDGEMVLLSLVDTEQIRLLASWDDVRTGETALFDVCRNLAQQMTRRIVALRPLQAEVAGIREDGGLEAGIGQFHLADRETRFEVVKRTAYGTQALPLYEEQTVGSGRMAELGEEASVFRVTWDSDAVPTGETAKGLWMRERAE